MEALDQAYSKLITDGGHLDAPMAVDGEQQERVRHINQVVVDGALISQLNDQEQQAWNGDRFLTERNLSTGTNFQVLDY